MTRDQACAAIVAANGTASISTARDLVMALDALGLLTYAADTARSQEETGRTGEATAIPPPPRGQEAGVQPPDDTRGFTPDGRPYGSAAQNENWARQQSGIANPDYPWATKRIRP